MNPESEFTPQDSYEKEIETETPPTESVEKGRAFIRDKLEAAGNSVIKFLKLDQSAKLDRLAISAVLVAAGAAYLYIRHEFPGPEVDPLWQSMQNFINNELPRIISSLQNGSLPEWNLTKNMGAADVTMAAITSLFSLQSLKEAAHFIVSKVKKHNPFPAI